MTNRPRAPRWPIVLLLLVHPALLVLVAVAAACPPSPEPDPALEGGGPEDGGPDQHDEGEGEGEGEGDPGAEGEGEGEPGGEGEGEGEGEGDGGVEASLACDAVTLPLAWDGTPVALTGDTRGAPNAATFDGVCQSQVLLDHRDSLYALTAPRAGRVAAELSADFDAVVYALRGTCLDVERVACRPQGPALVFDVALGDVLVLVVDGRATDEEGTFTLTLSYADPPTNDTCADEQLVDAVADEMVAIEGTLIGAAADLAEPIDCHGFSASDIEGRDVFFDVVGPAAGTLEIGIEAGFDAVLAAPGSCDVTTTPADRCDVFSPRLVLPTEAGEHHLIAVDGNDAGDLGTFTLTVRARGRPPLAVPGETCANASPLTAPAPGTTARYEVDLPALANDLGCAAACSSFTCGGDDGVFRINTPAAGTLRIEAEGMDTVLSAFAGAACSGAPAACADTGAFGDVMREQISVPTSAGGVITLVVDSFADFSTPGPVTLTLEMQP